MVEELPVGYYLDNFNYLLDYVLGQYADLLLPEETAFATGFQTLSLDARRLYVRLCSRKGPLFRDDKLRYAEIDVPAAISALAAAGYLDPAADAAAEQLLALATRAELAAICPHAPRSDSRAALLDRLAGCPADEVRAALPFRIVQPLHQDILQVYELLFFGNGHQDLTEFVLHELGITPYEDYVIQPSDRFFDDRRILEQTLQLYAVAEAASDAIDANDVDAMCDAEAAMPVPLNDALARRVAKIRNRIARQLERLDRPEEALALYAQSGVAPSRERQARLWHKMGRIDRAVDLCREIVSDPENEAEYEFGAAFARRILRRSPAAEAFPDPARGGICTRDISVAREPGINVEELARSWFEARGDGAWYVENGLFPGLFGLAFWDIIFMPRKGVFFNPFQRGPDDLFTPGFRDALGPRIEARLDMLADVASFRHRVFATFRDKQPRANHFVNWRVLSEPLLEAAFERIPVSHMLAVFERLLRDLRHNRSGFPDLVVFPAAGDYLLAEVKGPGDTLQDNQKRWLRFFGETRMPAEVVNVHWENA